MYNRYDKVIESICMVMYHLTKRESVNFFRDYFDFDVPHITALSKCTTHHVGTAIYVD